MNHKSFQAVVYAILLAGMTQPAYSDDIIFESGTLGPTGLYEGHTLNTYVGWSEVVGAFFQISEPVRTTQVGGHFVDREGGSFFGAIVKARHNRDFPDSRNLTTPDVLGVAILDFPKVSAEVFGAVDIRLDPGWYSLWFGSGLFGTAGFGGVPRTGVDIGYQTYVTYGSAGWGLLSKQYYKTHRFVIRGIVVPEPTPTGLTLAASAVALFTTRHRRVPSLVKN